MNQPKNYMENREWDVWRAFNVILSLLRPFGLYAWGTSRALPLLTLNPFSSILLTPNPHPPRTSGADYRAFGFNSTGNKAAQGQLKDLGIRKRGKKEKESTSTRREIKIGFHRCWDQFTVHTIITGCEVYSYDRSKANDQQLLDLGDVDLGMGKWYALFSLRDLKDLC